MNRLIFYSLLLSITLFIISCEEVPPGVNFTPTIDNPDTVNIATQKRNVLLEEVTGVRCVNCPAAHEIAQDIQAANPGRVSLVAVHAGQYAVRYPYSNYTFKIQEGIDINNMVGPSSQWPCADINRVSFPGLLSKFITPATTWAGYVNQELQDTLPKVRIGLHPSYNDASRQFDLGIDLYYTQDVATANNLNVMITESGMIDPQEIPTSIKPSGIDTYYVHRNVLRGMMTPFNGQAIAGSKIPGAPLSVTLTPFILPTGWNPDSCKVIAFVTEGTDSVLQVVETRVKK